MSGANVRIDNPAPLDYVTPSFPSLYWPFDAKPGAAQYLYFTKDIWRFTLFWTLTFYGVVHTAALFTGLANRVPLRLKQVGLNFNGKLTFGLSVAYLAVSAFQGLLAGTCIGFLLGAIYNAGFFRMSTWIPFTWALINSLVLIISSFTVGNGL